MKIDDAIRVLSFHFDASDRLSVAHLPEDFADWLMEEGRDEEAAEVLQRVALLEAENDEVSIEEVIDLLEEYGDVIEINEAVDYKPLQTYWDKYQLVREMDVVDEPYSDDGPLSWDKEAALVNQAIADMSPREEPVTPLDPDQPEFPITIYVRRGSTINDLLRRVAYSLGRHGYVDGVRDFANTLIAYTRVTRTEDELLDFAMTFVNLAPAD